MKVNNEIEVVCNDEGVIVNGNLVPHTRCLWQVEVESEGGNEPWESGCVDGPRAGFGHLLWSDSGKAEVDREVAELAVKLHNQWYAQFSPEELAMLSAKEELAYAHASVERAKKAYDEALREYEKTKSKYPGLSEAA